jgi:hypothetical protein
MDLVYYQSFQLREGPIGGTPLISCAGRLVLMGLGKKANPEGATLMVSGQILHKFQNLKQLSMIARAHYPKPIFLAQ